MKIHYNPKLKKRSQQLRKNSTFSERLLWKYLRSGQLNGYQFLRQKPIDEFIVDFYCKKVQLVIEIDGVTHNGKQSYDTRRENSLNELGLHVLRFDGYYVINNISGTLEVIMRRIEEIERKTSP